jgi:hypothetical protein
MESETQQSKDTHAAWNRGLFMLLFMLGCSIAQAMLNLMAVVQFFWPLFAGAPNQYLVRFGRSLSV